MMMRTFVRLSTSLAAVAALALSTATCAQAQSTASKMAGNGTYIATDPLANVRYDNRFDLSLGAAFDRMKAGPSVLQGASLGGLDLSGSYWFSKHWALEGSGRYYVGSSGVGQPNTNGVRGPFVAEQLFVAGGEWLGPHNKHGAISAHLLAGGAHFDSHTGLITNGAQGAAFYSNQIAPAAIIGGHIDLNRSPRWVFRLTPDAVMTHYTGYGISPKPYAQYDVNFAFSAGIEYKFKGKR
jgi:hypothetical protein